MTWDFSDLFALIALLLVVEGLYPAISPENWRKMLFKFASLSDNTIRISGLSCMILGAILLTVVHNWDQIESLFF